MNIKKFLSVFSILALSIPITDLHAAQQLNESHFALWLKEFIPTQHPDVKVVDHGHWFQAVISEQELTVSWAHLPESKLELQQVEGLYPQKSLFISSQTKRDWPATLLAKYSEGAGYFISAYDSDVVGEFDVAKLTVVQFDGDAENFVDSMIKHWKSKTQKKEKLRVIMMSDFPPIGVVKGGENIPNTQKSDPDDMQSMVRFLLYANEFDIEGLIASAGTFAMEAHKKNILGVLDRYEKVYENLKTHDPDYPTADYLRSVTYEGLGNNHGTPIKWGRNKQPYTEIRPPMRSSKQRTSPIHGRYTSVFGVVPERLPRLFGM